MPLYKIADAVVEMNPKYSETAHWYEPYLVTDKDVKRDFCIEAKHEDILSLVEKGKDITEPIAENMILCNLFNIKLLKGYGGYIHSSALMYEDKVYLFSANSGVGKSTHTKKWCRLFPDKAKVINDDKPSYRIIDDKCYIYGTPFAGGTDVQHNAKGELGAIVFLERSEENRLERIGSKEALTLLMNQTPKKYHYLSVDRILSIYSHILTNYPVYKLYCADNDNAVEVAFQIIN